MVVIGMMDLTIKEKKGFTQKTEMSVDNFWSSILLLCYLAVKVNEKLQCPHTHPRLTHRAEILQVEKRSFGLSIWLKSPHQLQCWLKTKGK